MSKGLFNDATDTGGYAPSSSSSIPKVNKSFVSVCLSGSSVTNVYLYCLLLKLCSSNRMACGVRFS